MLDKINAEREEHMITIETRSNFWTITRVPGQSARSSCGTHSLRIRSTRVARKTGRGAHRECATSKRLSPGCVSGNRQLDLKLHQQRRLDHQPYYRRLPGAPTANRFARSSDGVEGILCQAFCRALTDVAARW